MLRRFSTRRVIGLFLFDWLGSIGIVILATYLRLGIGRVPMLLSDLLEEIHIPVRDLWKGLRHGDFILESPILILVSIIWPFIFVVFSVYDGRRNGTLMAELLNVLQAICISTITLAGLLYLTYRTTPRILFMIFFLLDVIILLGYRVGLYFIQHEMTGQMRKDRRVVIVIGAGQLGQDVVSQLVNYSRTYLKIIGYLDDDLEKLGNIFQGYPVLGTLDQAEAIVKSHHVEYAIVALPMRAYERLVEICETLQILSVQVHVIPDLVALTFSNASLDKFGGIPVIGLGLPGILGWNRHLKRIFDVLAVSVGLIVLSPLFLIIAVLIKLDSNGSIFFYHERIGLNGCTFGMWKFRTMMEGADQLLENFLEDSPNLKAEWDAKFKLKNDPRKTRIGRILRSWSLDELPQLYNVLKGEMSLVGPRPIVEAEIRRYREDISMYKKVRPGLTGLWQVSGRADVSYKSRIGFDTYYVVNWSFWLDITILFRTFWVLLKRKGAF
jgi:exopolysaccharide biosynthesis polyprenyl glycosylphosphotransferase